MSEMTSVETQQQQQQQYVSGGSNTEHHCKDCGVNFESEKSLEVHVRYHQENLLNQWANKAQQEESNNNHSKTGNHNNHVNVNRDNVTVPTDSSDPSSMSPSQDPASSQQQQQQQLQQPQQQQQQQQQQPQQQPQQQTPQQQQQQQQQQQTPQQQQQQQQQPQPTIHAIACPSYDPFQASMFTEPSYFIQNDQSYMLPHHFSPSQEEAQSNGGNGNYGPRYHPYPPYSTDRVASNSTSPQNPPFQCDKCGVVYDEANQLGEHMRTNHLNSPSAYPSAPQYQQLGNSPQQQGQQLHPSPPLSNQPQQQPAYDYNGGQAGKSEVKQEPEEQAELLDLDSHKVQTHRYEEELIRLQQQQQQQQQQQGLQMQMHHQQVMQQQQQQQQQRIGSHSVSSMLSWPQSAAPTHDYHPVMPTMGAIENVPPMADQSQFMRGQHMPVEHGHQGSTIITSTQPMPSHPMPAGFVQQPPKAPTIANQSWKSNEPRRPKTYNCSACNKWFTSSGHLKRHYNTTLHKNAVKNGKEPDPATMPISTHHHPARDNSAAHQSGGRGGGAPARSPDLSSRSPPNLMAGPSGEATGDLLHTPTTLCNNHSNSSNSSSDSSAVALVQQQQQLVHLPHLLPLNTSVPSLAGHHQQQMGSVPHQLGHQQQQQLHLPTGSPGQSVHSTTSPMLPPVASHMNCPSSSHHTLHMTSPQGTVHPARMISPTAMGGTTMPHQQYPNALPPHVTTTTNPPAVLLESIKVVTPIQLTTIGNEQSEQQQQQHVLPGFGTIEQSLLPRFAHFSISRYVVEQNQLQSINVGGLSAEDIVPQESFESSASNYDDPFSPLRYKLLTNGEATLMQTSENGATAECSLVQLEQTHLLETNNNLVQAKEDVDPNVHGARPKKGRKAKAKQRQVVNTNGANCISEDNFYACIDCNKTFEKACYLTQHNKSSHSGEKPFKCAQCGKRFPNEEVRGKHTQMHTLLRRYKCDSCPKIFAHKTDLKRHSCVHTGLRPFQCEICHKGFIRQDHMKKHRLTHNKKNTRNTLQSQRQSQRMLLRNQRHQRFNAHRENLLTVENGVQQLDIEFYIKSENKSPEGH